MMAKRNAVRDRIRKGCGGGDEVSKTVQGHGNNALIRNAIRWQHTAQLKAEVVCVYESKLLEEDSEVVAECSISEETDDWDEMR